MTTLDERFLSSYGILAGLGRVDSEGVPIPNTAIMAVNPDQWRIISEACFGYLWNRTALTPRQRSLITMSGLVVLRRDDNLHGHLLSGLDMGFSPAQINEIFLQLIFYVGAPMVNTATRVARDVYQKRGLTLEPFKVFDTTETPDALYQRGLSIRTQVLGDGDGGSFDQIDSVDADWDRYLLEYLWGSVWGRPGLDLQERCICTLTAMVGGGTDDAIRDYVGAALRLGLPAASVREIMFHLSFYIGDSQARRGKALAEEVISAQ